MIYTLTANPAIDYNIACDGLWRCQHRHAYP